MSFKCRECDKVIMSFKRDTCPRCVAKADDVEAKFNREWAERQERMRRDAYRADIERQRRLQDEAAQVRQQDERDAMAVMLMLNQNTPQVYSYSNPAPVAPSPLYNFQRDPVPEDAPVYQPSRCDDTPSYTSREESSYSCHSDSSSSSSSSSD